MILLPGIACFIALQNNKEINVVKSISMIFIFGYSWKLIVGYVLLIIIPNHFAEINLILSSFLFLSSWHYNFPNLQVKYIFPNLKSNFVIVSSIIVVIYILVISILILIRKSATWQEEWDFFKLAIQIGNNHGNITYQYLQPGIKSTVIEQLPILQRTHSPGLSIIFSFAFYMQTSYNSLIGLQLLQTTIWVSLYITVFNFTQARFGDLVAVLTQLFTFLNPLLFRYFLFLTDAPIFILMIMITLDTIYNAKHKKDWFLVYVFSINIVLLRPEGGGVAAIILLSTLLQKNDKIYNVIKANIIKYFAIILGLFYSLRFLSTYIYYTFLNLPFGISQIAWAIISISRESPLHLLILALVGNEYREGYFTSLPLVLGRLILPTFFYMGIIFLITKSNNRKNIDIYFLLLFGFAIFGLTPPTATSAIRYGILNLLPIYYIVISYAYFIIFEDMLKNGVIQNLNNIQIKKYKFSFSRLNPTFIKENDQKISLALLLLMSIGGLMGDIIFYEIPLYSRRLQYDQYFREASSYFSDQEHQNVVLGVHGMWTYNQIVDFGYVEIGTKNLMQLINALSVNWLWIGCDNFGNPFPNNEKYWNVFEGKYIISDKLNSTLNSANMTSIVRFNAADKLILIEIVRISI